MRKITIYCDGGCRGNHRTENIGGYGAVIMYDEEIEEIYGSEENTTNNKMELTACIKALESVKYTHIPIELYSDSKYVVDNMNNWVDRWAKNAWHTNAGNRVKNQELWEKLLELQQEFQSIEFIHCKGHSNVPGNIMADTLVNIAMDDYISSQK